MRQQFLEEEEEEEIVRLPAAAFSSAKPESEKKKKIVSPKKVAKADTPLEMNFGQARKEVWEMGVGGLDKRAKKALDNERILAFGGVVKNPKMPLKMLQGIRKAEKIRAQRAAEERRASGVVVPVLKLDNVLRAHKANKKKRTNDIPLDDIRDGVMRVGPRRGKKKGRNN